MLLWLRPVVNTSSFNFLLRMKFLVFQSPNTLVSVTYVYILLKFASKCFFCFFFLILCLVVRFILICLVVKAEIRMRLLQGFYCKRKRAAKLHFSNFIFVMTRCEMTLWVIDLESWQGVWIQITFGAGQSSYLSYIAATYQLCLFQCWKSVELNKEFNVQS